MSLPLPVIERLFERLQLTYGRDFLSSSEGTDIGAIKSFWAHELAGFAGNLKAIGKALESLPERVPNVIVFRNICLRYLPEPALGLPAPKADPAIIAAALAAIKPAEGGHHRKSWARVLQKRDEAGERLNPNQIRCYKNAIGLHPNGAQL
jgi:hypothetical protein